MKPKTVLLAIVAAASMAGGDIARAQTSQVLGRDWEEVIGGSGVKVGDGTVLHPVAGLETGVISNVFYEQDAGRTAGVLRVVGEAAIASLPAERLADPERTAYERPLWRRWAGSIYQAHDGPFWRDDEGDDGENPGAPPKLEFRAGLRAFYEEYISAESDVRAQRNLGFNANAHLHLFPYDLIAVTVDDDLTRSIRPTNFESSSDLDRWINNFRLAARLQAGGRALIPELRVHNRIDYFESENSQFANRLQTTLGSRLNWWFTRFTRLYADASIGFFGGLGGGSAGIEKVASRPVRALIGGSTPLTPRTAVRGHVGFAKGFYESGAEFTGPLLAAAFSWRHNDFGVTSLGYHYDFQDSINANFYSQHGVTARMSQQIRRFLIEGTASIYLRHYDGVPMALGGGTTRDDIILALGGVGRFLLRDWLAITAQLQIVSDQTDFVSSPNGNPDDPSFTRFELFGGVVSAF